jgi:dTMP kinase
MPTDRSHAHPGLFLVFDGPDGGGKSTQAVRLKTWLEERGFDVVACRDPGGTPLGDRLRSMLLDRETVPISMRAEMLLYMASRAQLVDAVIAPALAAGRIVISDRYLLANIVYQGRAGGLHEEEIAMVGMIATAGLLPDLTIVLDIAPAQALARLGAARDRIEDRPLFYQERVRAGFLAAAREQGAASTELAEGGSVYPAPIVVIDASVDADTVFKRIQQAVEQALSRRGPT